MNSGMVTAWGLGMRQEGQNGGPQIADVRGFSKTVFCLLRVACCLQFYHPAWRELSVSV